MAIIAACYVGYLAGIFLDGYKTAIGVILTILCVMGIIGLFALKSLLLFSALVTDGYNFNGVGMIWTFEFFETLVIVITAVVSCFRRGLRRYSLFILAYFLGVFVCFIWLFLGFGLCVGLCVAVGVCRGDEDYGLFATSYSSGSFASSRSSVRIPRRIRTTILPKITCWMATGFAVVTLTTQTTITIRAIAEITFRLLRVLYITTETAILSVIA
ncbi:MAG: hypothetical protein ACLUSP_09885 [Christensenellales bacterium]